MHPKQRHFQTMVCELLGKNTPEWLKNNNSPSKCRKSHFPVCTVGVVSLVSAGPSRTLGCTGGGSGCFCVESPEPLSCVKTHRLGQGSHKHVVTVRFQHSVWWDFFPFEGKTSFRKLVFVLLSRVPVSPAPCAPPPKKK